MARANAMASPQPVPRKPGARSERGRLAPATLLQRQAGRDRREGVGGDEVVGLGLRHGAHFVEDTAGLLVLPQLQV